MRISDLLRYKIEVVIKELLTIKGGDTAKLNNFIVLKTKRLVKAEYTRGYDKQFILFTFDEIKQFSDLDIMRELDKEAVKNSAVRKKELDKKLVITRCYGVEKRWTDRNKAEEYYLECMRSSEGAERDRYVTVYLKLIDGFKYCSDD